MGYELHITRAKFWAENNGDEITDDEWLRLIEGDSELSLVADNGPFFARWDSSSQQYWSWFDWSEGNIYTKNPDRETVTKMLKIAALLNAGVQGDDGEAYTRPDDFQESLDDYVPTFDEQAGDATDLPRSLKREKSWVRIEYILVAVVVLVWILYDMSR